MNDHDDSAFSHDQADVDAPNPTAFDAPDAPAAQDAGGTAAQAPDGGHAGDEPALPVDIGRALPPAAQQVPVLAPAGRAAALGSRTDSTIAEGIHFAGNATLRGACSVAGTVDGHLRQADGASVAVVVTETGRVNGDIHAQRISVMGQTEGLLDAGAGEVSLHDGSTIHGTVRYGRIQVNGANLNATLERVVPAQG